jgi:hypothetical protein
MPITVPAYQLKFDLDLPEEESSSVLSAEDIQLRKDVARAFIENPETWPKGENGKPKKPFWFDSYEKLSAGRWPFRVAVLIAWLGTPKKYRWPKTQDELADMLGMGSDRQFSVWIAKNPQIKAMVHEAWKERALDRISDSMEAMFEVAANPDYKGRGDRELHFKVAEILTDKVILDNSGNVDLSKLSFEEKLRLAGLDNAEALLALKKQLAERQSVLEDYSEDEVPSVPRTSPPNSEEHPENGASKRDLGEKE